MSAFVCDHTDVQSIHAHAVSIMTRILVFLTFANTIAVYCCCFARDFRALSISQLLIQNRQMCHQHAGFLLTSSTGNSNVMDKSFSNQQETISSALNARSIKWLQRACCSFDKLLFSSCHFSVGIMSDFPV